MTEYGYSEHLDEEFVMRWMGLVIADCNNMSDQEAAQAFRQMITHLESHIKDMEMGDHLEH